jgi:DNA-binding beta-propeller fold protein YncE
MKYFSISILLILTLSSGLTPGSTSKKPHRYLYVAVPGIRNYLEYGGHGLLVFDIDNGHQFIKRISCQGSAPDGTPSNIKGIDVSLVTQCVYISTIHTLQCIDLKTEKIIWERKFEKGCDRLSVSPDGKEIYVPSFEKEDWYILDAKTGDTKQTLSPDIKSHNTVYGSNGKEVYLEGLNSPYLLVTNTHNPSQIRKVGPFGNVIRPFTVNGKQTKVFVNVNELLGFEAGDLVTGKKLYSVKVEGYEKGPVKRHGCPSHGIALSPDEKEVWIADGFNQKIHVFELNNGKPLLKHSIAVRDQPGWITFSKDGAYAYSSTGEIIDGKSKKIIYALKDENGQPVHSEKMLEIDIDNSRAVDAADQFGLGRRF